MKNILCLALLAAAAAVPFQQASAQEQRATVTVPFAFHVGNSTLPAGSYTIVSDSMRHTLGITGVDPKLHAGAIVMTDSFGNSRANLAVFHKYGNQYFLRRIVRSEGHSAVFLTPSKAEKQARRQTETAGLPIQDPVVLAINDTPVSLVGLDSSR